MYNDNAPLGSPQNPVSVDWGDGPSYLALFAFLIAFVPLMCLVGYVAIMVFVYAVKLLSFFR